ncbi:hypothetical protein UF64_10195 [Thalassospira sp. HJ]|nr:hypothetical protein UF64_10195 [Thalassospira sp. HJ]
MAVFISVKFKEKPAVRGGTPDKGFDVEVCRYKDCPEDQPDLHDLALSQKLERYYLPAVLLRVSAQI